MTIGVEDGLTWVVDGQGSGVTVTVSIVGGVTVDGELGSLVNQRSGPGIGTNVVGVPKDTTEVHNSGFVGI